MRRLHPVLILLLTVLFAGQTVVGVAAQCGEVRQSGEHKCCCESAQHSAEECGCYDAPDQPANPEPVVQAHPVPLLATLSPAVESTPDPQPRRLTTVESPHLPAAPTLRVHNDRAPPTAW